MATKTVTYSEIEEEKPETIKCSIYGKSTVFCEVSYLANRFQILDLRELNTRKMDNTALVKYTNILESHNLALAKMFLANREVKVAAKVFDSVMRTQSSQ